MGLFFGILKVSGLFRVDPKDEEEGLDHSYHGGSAYGETNGEYKPSYAKVRHQYQTPTQVHEGQDFLVHVLAVRKDPCDEWPRMLTRDFRDPCRTRSMT